MSNCGCNNTPNCGCSTPKASYEVVDLNQGCSESTPGSECISNKGKFFDRTTESFVVPAVGKEVYIPVCNATLWAVGQFIAVNLTDNKIAAFRITGRTNKKIKVLNGCNSSGNNGIIGNPEAGTVIPVDSVLYPIPPSGCASSEAARIIDTLTEFGLEAVLQMLAESPDICFTNTPELAEDEEGHLFVGTKPDCDCAPESAISSCLRKALDIFTGQAGRTLCMPEVATISIAQIDGATPKRIALFDENGCLKKGPTPSDFISCNGFGGVTEDAFNAITVCKEGVSKNLTPTEEGNILVAVSTTDEDDETVLQWQQRKRNVATVEYATSADGGSSLAGEWRIRPLNSIRQQTPGFIGLTSNIITINKSGRFLVNFFCVFYGSNDAQVKIVNTEDESEVVGYGSAVFSPNPSLGYTAIATSQGYGYIEVPEGETKKIRMDYRVEVTRSTTGLGRTSVWAERNVYAQVQIVEV